MLLGVALPQRGGWWPESCGFAIILMRNGILTLGFSGRRGISRHILVGWTIILDKLHPRMDYFHDAQDAAERGMGYKYVAAIY